MVLACKVQPLKSENTISSHNTDMDNCLQASISVKTVLFERCRAPEKQKPKDLMNQMEPCKTPETFILLKTNLKRILIISP